MADQKVSDLPSLSGAVVDPADLLYIVDSSAGTAGSKKITIGQFQLAPYSGGTINGVTYFDGTKVLASGSTLTFDGTNLGVGTSSPGARAHTVNTSAGAATVGAFLQNADNTLGTEVRLAFAANSALLSSDRYGWIGYVNTGGTNGGALTFATTPGGTPATEQMRLDESGNLGVGTSSPAQILDISKAQNAATVVALRNSNAGAIASVSFIGNADTAVGRFIVYSSGAAGGLANCVSIEQSTANPILFYQNSSESMRLDSSGNLGVGLTSVTTGYKLDVNGAVNARASAANTNGLRVEATAGYVSNLSLFRLGYAEWFIGSANNSASLNISVTDGTHATPSMTFTSAGDVGVGTAIPATKLAVYGGASGTDTRATVGNASAALQLGVDGSNDAVIAMVNNYAMAFFTNNNERARITAAGDFITNVNAAAPTLGTNSTMSFELTSNTSLKIVVRGTDGVTRSATLTLA